MSSSHYLDLLADSVRIEAFRRAIGRCVRPGQVVLDLGTGAGTYAMFAARAGARVIAVDGAPVIELARELAERNGLADRITFLSGWSTELEPPERADVLIYEDYSAQLVDPAVAELMTDARRRWLKPTAVAIPEHVRLMAAPVSAGAAYDNLVRFAGQAYGLRVDALEYSVLNETHQVWLPSDAPLAPALEIFRLEPMTAMSMSFRSDAAWGSLKGGTLNALAIWIELFQGDELLYANRPGGGLAVWGQVLLPLGEPLDVASGDRIEANIAALGSPARGPDWWQWRVGAGGVEQEMNTFRAAPLSIHALRGARSDERKATDTARDERQRAEA